MTDALIKMCERLCVVDPCFPVAISMIPGFPYQDFSHFQFAVARNTIHIARFRFHRDPRMLGIVASAKHEALFSILFGVRFLIPIVSIVLAFTVSWWFLLGLLHTLLGVGSASRFYDQTLLEVAPLDELAFCLLFFNGDIHVVYNGHSISWAELTETSVSQAET